jgi:predicted ATPase
MTARRIVITGAGGVGKTSLSDALARALQLPLIPEVARQLCQELHYQSPASVPDQQLFRRQVLSRQIALENSTDSFVSDRSAIDCWVLWQRWNFCTAMSYDSENYYESCRQQAESYSRVVYIPPMFPPSEDNFRWIDADYIKQIDRIVRMTLYDWGLNNRTLIISSEGVQRRVEEVSAWLEN